MSQTNGTVATGGMAIDDHYICSLRLQLVEELAAVQAAELAEVYGEGSDFATLAAEALRAVRELRPILREQAFCEHPRSTRRLRKMYIKPQPAPRSIRPGMRRGGGAPHRAGMPA